MGEMMQFVEVLLSADGEVANAVAVGSNTPLTTIIVWLYTLRSRYSRSTPHTTVTTQ